MALHFSGVCERFEFSCCQLDGEFFAQNVSANFRCLLIGSGRITKLKIHRWRQRTGSSPVTGTKRDRHVLHAGPLLSWFKGKEAP